MRKILYTACLLGLCLVLAGCSRYQLQGKLVGRWANYFGGGHVWEFKESGELRLLTKQDGREEVLDSGTYEVIDGETIEAKWAKGGVMRLKIKINDNGKMLITLPDNSERIFVRVES